MIVIEGCDGTGKTTLAKNLASLLGLEYVHESTPKGLDNFQYYLDRALELPRNAVLDRFHLGEYVYPKLKNDGRLPLLPWQQSMIERVLLAKGAILIRTQLVRSDIVRTIEERGDDYIVPSEVATIEELFHEVTQHTILPTWTRNFNQPDPATIADLCTYYRYSIHRSYALRNYSGCGQLIRPDWILVGDCFADGTEAQDGKMAFTAPDKSSVHLHKTLELVTGEGYITNANKFEDDAENIYAIQRELETLGRTMYDTRRDSPTVIALGSEADAFLNRAGINHGKVNHPSWWRRFKHDHMAEFAIELNREIQGDHFNDC